MRTMPTVMALTLGLLVLAMARTPAEASQHGRDSGPMHQGAQRMMSEGLLMPMMSPARGRKLFASKGCVVCHSVNGVGGGGAPALDADNMKRPMNPFAFAAKMWRGAEAMIYLQREELGEQIELTGQELADIIAFGHDRGEQAKFSKADIPPRIRAVMDGHGHDEADAHHDEEEENHRD